MKTLKLINLMTSPFYEYTKQSGVMCSDNERYEAMLRNIERHVTACNGM